MICQPCRDGADIPAEKILPGEPSKEAMHAKCVGPEQCACQHRVKRSKK